MKWTTYCIIAIVSLFFVAEIVRPTHPLFPKRTIAHGLVLRSQDVMRGSRNTLDAELLENLPRIHPDALGTLLIQRDPLGGDLVLSGWIADPYARGAGAAVFAIVRGRRIANARTSYEPIKSEAGAHAGVTSFQIDLPKAAATASAALAVGLVASDNRGFFLLRPAHSIRVANAQQKRVRLRHF